MHTEITYDGLENRRPRKRPYLKRLSAEIGIRRVALGLLTGAAAYGLLGTVSAIWENPFFVRMTPVVGFEYVLLATLAVLSGLYVTVRRPFCSNKSAGIGGILGFTGIACPICNKILVLIFGGELLLSYLEPVRVYVGILGILVVGAALLWELHLRRLDLDLEKSPGQL